MVASTTGALLLEHLGASARDFRTPERFVAALLTLGKLPANNTLQEILAWLKAEDGIGKRNLPGVFAFKCSDGEIHDQAPSFDASATLAA